MKKIDNGYAWCDAHAHVVIPDAPGCCANVGISECRLVPLWIEEEADQ